MYIAGNGNAVSRGRILPTPPRNGAALPPQGGAAYNKMAAFTQLYINFEVKLEIKANFSLYFELWKTELLSLSSYLVFFLYNTLLRYCFDSPLWMLLLFLSCLIHLAWEEMPEEMFHDGRETETGKL